MTRGGGGGHDHSHDHGSLEGHGHSHGGHVTDHNSETSELTGCDNGRTRAPQAEINLAEVRANQRYVVIRLQQYSYEGRQLFYSLSILIVDASRLVVHAAPPPVRVVWC